MTTSVDPQAAAAAVLQRLTGPGGPFELTAEEVLGARIPVFRNRGSALHEALADSARHGDRDYIVTATERISFTEHARRVRALAASLREDHGVVKGDRVAIAAANSPEWIITFWATVSVGAIAVAFNAWWTKRELEYGVGHARPKLVVADAKRAALLTDVDVPVLTVERDVPSLVAAHPDAPWPSEDVAEDDPAVIIYTSGTSGRPKGAVHSHRNLMSVIEYHRLNDALASAFGDPTDPRDRRYLLALPLFHIASLHNLAVPRLATGSTVVMHQGAFDADKVLRLIERERVTNWGAVPTMANRMMEHDVSTYDLSSLTAFSLASAPSSPAFKQRLRERLPFAQNSLVDSYGLTESCTAVAVATPLDLAQAPGTLGRPIVGVEMEIRDPLGRPLPEGHEGEVCVRSAYNMLGYWEDADATASAIREERWLHTGDIGVMEDGRVRLTTRRSDLIIRGGENVYPAEIEHLLVEHPGVRECAVIGVPHPDLGQEVLAVVVVEETEPASEEQLRAYAAEHLSYFKVPSQWRILTESLPRNATGKVIRAAL